MGRGIKEKRKFEDQNQKKKKTKQNKGKRKRSNELRTRTAKAREQERQTQTHAHNRTANNMSLRTPKRSRTNEEDEEQDKDAHTQLLLPQQQQQRRESTLLSTPVRLKNGFGTPSPPSPSSTTATINNSRRRPSPPTLQGIFMSPINKRRVGAAAHGRVLGHDDDAEHETGSDNNNNNNNNSNNNNNEDEHESESESEQEGRPGTSSLLPTTPKSRRSEVFLSPSPRLSSPPTAAAVAAARRPAGERPIREISHTLRTRLNYALVKLQNGWEDKTLPELETQLAPAVETSPRRYHNRFPDSADAGTSAHTAFMQALGGHPPREEATAVETLMLLSSPTKKQQHRPVAAMGAAGEPGTPADETEPESDTEVETS